MNLKLVFAVCFVLFTFPTYAFAENFGNNFAEHEKDMYSDVKVKAMKRHKVLAINKSKLASAKAKKGNSNIVTNDGSGPIGGVIIPEGSSYSGDIIIINDIDGDIISVDK